MSFPKAKLQHFYEVQSCAPPPGTYDPKMPTSVKGAVIEKSERFSESIGGTGSSETTPNKEYHQLSRLKFSTPNTYRLSSRPWQAKTNNSVNELYTPDSSTNSKELSLVGLEDDSRIQELEERNKSLESEVKALQDLISGMKSEYEIDIEKYKTEISEIHDKYSKAVLEIDEKCSIMNKIQCELNLKSELVTELQEKCKSLSDALSHKASIMLNVEEEKLIALAELEEVKDRKNKLEVELSQNIQIVLTLQNDKELLQKTVIEEKENLTKQRDTLKQELVQEREYKIALETKLTQEHENSIAALKESLNQHLEDCVKERNEYEEKLTEERIKHMEQKIEYEEKLSQEQENHMKETAALEQKLIQDQEYHNKETAALNEELRKLSEILAIRENDLADLRNQLDITEMKLKSSDENHFKEMSTALHNNQLKLKETRQQFVCKMERHEKETFDFVKENFVKIQTVHENLSHFKKYVDEILRLEYRSTSLYKQQEDLLKSNILKLQNDMKDKDAEYERKLVEIKEGMDINWKQRYLDLEALMSPFQEQLKAYESEKQALELRNAATETILRDLAVKYADIIGHQNHRQKIKHLMQLKEQIFEQKNKISALETKVISQKRTIDKLKSELFMATKKKQSVPVAAQPKGKENATHGTIDSRVQPLGQSSYNTN